MTSVDRALQRVNAQKRGHEREELCVVDDQFGAPTFAGFIAATTVRIIEQINSSDAA